MEGKIADFETKVTIATTSNIHLKVMVNNQEQYSHEIYMIITGIATPDKNISNNDHQEAILNIIQLESGITKDKTKIKIDKMHPIQKPKQGKQQWIIKFKTVSFKEVAYSKHKNKIKMIKTNQQHDNKNVVVRPKQNKVQAITHQKKNWPS